MFLLKDTFTYALFSQQNNKIWNLHNCHIQTIHILEDFMKKVCMKLNYMLYLPCQKESNPEHSSWYSHSISAVLCLYHFGTTDEGEDIKGRETLGKSTIFITQNLDADRRRLLYM